MKEAENWCKGCETNCCDHFVLNNWAEWKILELVERFPFLKIFEHWVNEDESEHTWVMECDRLQTDGGCEGYPDNRPYFCSWAGERYKPFSECKLFEMKVRKNPDRCE